jgi:hypothetical protein
MKMKISVVESATKITVYENIYDISEEGDIDVKVNCAISEARKLGLPPWGWFLSVDTA